MRVRVRVGVGVRVRVKDWAPHTLDLCLVKVRVRVS